jgi:hypothetical protein
MKTNAGNDIQAAMMGGGGVGLLVTATSPTTTGFTTSGLVSGAHVGRMVVAGSVYGVITANTTTTVTVDRWSNPGTPGGTAGTTPSAGSYVILPGNAPLMFMGLTANNSAPAGTDTSLTAEITTAGLIRQLAAYAHTTGAAGYTLTGTFTAQSGDVSGGSVTVAKAGVFSTLASSLMGFETLLSATATFAAAGDQLTLTQSVSN